MKDNSQLIGQVLLLLLGPVLLKHGVSIDGGTIDQIAGTISIVAGIVWKFYHWNSTPSSPASSTSSTSAANVPLFLLIGSLCLAPAFFGCKATPQQIGYRTVATTAVTVDTAMNEWGAYVAAVHPPASQEAAVKRAYEKYQQDMLSVCDVGELYAGYSTTNSSGSTGYSAALQQAIADADRDISDLETLIASYGVKLK
jgi:hypothetical protein